MRVPILPRFSPTLPRLGHALVFCCVILSLSAELDRAAFAVDGTEAGLVVAHRNGVMVLDKGATAPRALPTTKP